jgi:L-threonylcarbamoyladenylate synthase
MLFQKYNPSIAIAASVMHQGGVIAYPTEAVWGLGCDPHNELAVRNILHLKQRDVSKGLILVAASIEQFSPYLDELTEGQRQILLQSWPGPSTWLVPRNHATPMWVSGDHSSVALRVSANPYVRHLCDTFGGPIVSTSANPQGKPAARQAWQVHGYFHHAPLLNWIAKGSVGSNAQPSAITDLLSGAIVR